MDGLKIQTQNKKLQLKKVVSAITGCTLCRKGKIGRPVSGEGNPNARVIFVGEAPGKEETKTGRPFAGRAGKLLRSLIKEIGLSEKKGLYHQYR